MNAPQPYAAAAASVLAAGYSPLPLPQRQKSPPPDGWTGGGPMAGPREVARWARAKPLCNLGIRLPPEVIGIDVDAYDAGPGKSKTHSAACRRRAWDELAARCGPLPASPRSTARPDDGASGIRLYRAPAGWRAAGKLPAILCCCEAGGESSPGEVIQHHHRYVVAPPSIHPTGQLYRWLDGGALLPAADLPRLPAAWLAALDERASVHPAPSVPAPRGPGPAEAGHRPGDEYNDRADWREILEPIGAAVHHETATQVYWTRPGKHRGEGHSAVTGWTDGSDRLYVFTSEWPPFEPDRPYDKFAAFALLNHRGDMTAAARDLAARGFGQPATNGHRAAPPVEPAAVEHERQDEPGQLRARVLALLDSDRFGLYLRDVVEHCGQAAQAELDTLLADGLVMLRDRRWFRTPPAAEPVTLAPVPAYPVEAMPEPLGAFIRWAAADGLVPAFAAAAGLAALASLCGSAEVRVGSATFRPSLWLPLTGPPSLAKGSTVNHAFEELAALHADALERWEASREAWDRDREACGKDRAALEALGPPPAKPRNPRASIATIEAIARACLAANGVGRGYSIAVAPDELGGFLDSLGRYGNGRGAADRAWLREMWTGAPVQIYRVGDGGTANAVDIFLPRPVVVICGPLLADETGNLGSDARGDRARWLMHYSPPGFRVRLSEQARPKPDVWTGAIRKLYAVRDRRVWQLRGEAFRLWDRAAARWQAMEEEPWPEHVIQFLRKANHHAAAVALVLAEAQQAMGAAAYAPEHSGEWLPWTGGDIPAEAMRGAIAEVDYSLGCWQSIDSGNAFALSAQDREKSAAVTRLLAWLEKRPAGNEGLSPGEPARPRATTREILMANVAGIRKRADLDVLLHEYGGQFPGCVLTVEPRGGQGGGHPTTYVYAPKRMPGTVLGQHRDPPPEPPNGTVKPQVTETDPPADERCWVPDTVLPNTVLPNTVNPAIPDTPDPGPCGWCGHPRTSTGPGGKPLCDHCMGGEAEQEHARQQPRRQTRAQRQARNSPNRKGQ